MLNGHVNSTQKSRDVLYDPYLKPQWVKTPKRNKNNKKGCKKGVKKGGSDWSVHSSPFSRPFCCPFSLRLLINRWMILSFYFSTLFEVLIWKGNKPQSEMDSNGKKGEKGHEKGCEKGLLWTTLLSRLHSCKYLPSWAHDTVRRLYLMQGLDDSVAFLFV